MIGLAWRVEAQAVPERVGVTTATPPVSTAASGSDTKTSATASGDKLGAETSSPYEQLFAAVTVNGKAITQFATTLRTKEGRFLVPLEVLRDARITGLAAPAVSKDGQDYYALDALPGARYQFEEGQQTLSVQVLPSSFESSIFDHAQPRYTPTSPPFGLILNHDMQLVRTSSGQQFSGLLEGGMFSSLGVLTSDTVSANLLSGARMRRLDTRFTKEMPGRMRVLTMGDTISASDTWAQSVHYAGVQLSRNFAIQPSFIPFALPAMQTQAAEPSMVDIYMNNVLVMKQAVDAGPFSIQNIPVITPQGDMRMVVTDTTGRQQVITRSYLSVSELLRKGVSAYSYEGGIMRWGEGTPSDSYHTPFVAGTHRYGLRDHVTLSVRGEVLGANQTFGMGSEFGLKRLGLVEGNVAVSHSSAGVGTLAYGLIQRQTRAWQLAGSLQTASGSFRQLGLAPGQSAPRLQAQAQVGRSFGRLANLGIGYLLHECQGVVSCTAQYQHLSAATASVGLRLWSWGTLGSSLTYSPAVQHGASLGLTLSIPLHQLRQVMASTTLSGASKSGLVEFQQSLPNGDGYGYRARLNSDHTDLAAGLDYRNRYGTYSFAAERSGNGTEWSTEEKGGIVFLGGQIMPTRWLDESFALVDVPGQPGIRVYANNQYIAKTDWRGRAVVPVVPFDGNVVRLDDKDVPVQLAMDLAERRVVPFSRTGMLVRFKAVETKGATVVLQAADGSPLPLGSQVSVAGSAEGYEVAYDGEVFIPDLVTPAQLHVRGKGFECEVDVPKAPDRVELPRLGPFGCGSK